jgi:hypothetical protein
MRVYRPSACAVFVPNGTVRIHQVDVLDREVGDPGSPAAGGHEQTDQRVVAPVHEGPPCASSEQVASLR